jgi:Ala-tRNA(Pro) deacylase
MNAIDRMTTYLTEHQVPFEMLAHPHTATSRQAALAAGVDSHRLVKAVLLEAPDCFLAAMIPADEQVRLGMLSQDYGLPLSLASEDDVNTLFKGCDPGSAPGLPIAWDVEMVWEDDLLAQPDLYLEAGDHEHLLHVQTQYLREMLGDVPHCHFARAHTQH